MLKNPIVIKKTAGDSRTISLLNSPELTELGSNVDVIYLYADYSTASVVKVSFLLQNGVYVPARPITLSDMDVTSLVPEGEIEEGYALWEYAIPSAVLANLVQKGSTLTTISFKASEITDDTDYLGIYTTSSEVDATINAELKVEYPTATTGQWSNVYQTTSNQFVSWVFDGTDFIKRTESPLIINEQQIDYTLPLGLTINGTIVSPDEEIDVTVTEIILDELAELHQKIDQFDLKVNEDLTTYSELTVVSANDRIYIQKQSDGQGYYTTIAEIVTDVGSEFTSITLLNGATNEAVGVFDGTNITWTYQPIGSDEPVNAEMFKNLFVQVRCSEDITEGQLIQYDGVIGASGIVLGKPFVPSELNVNPEYILGIATQSGQSATNDNVLVNWYGAVNDIDTSAYTEGAVLYANTAGTDGVDNGTLTNSEPIAPNAQIRVGVTLITNPSNGSILVRPDFGLALSELHDVYCNGGVNDKDLLQYNTANQRWECINGPTTYADKGLQWGSFKETFDFKYNTTTSQMELTNADGVSTILTEIFDDGETELDVTSCTCSPTFGSSQVPQKNYFYILKSAKTAITSSTGGWPTEPHIKIAFAFFLDETTTDSDGGPLVNQNWNDHAYGTDLMGHIVHMAEKLRRIGGTYFSGLDGTGSDGWVDDVAGTLYIKMSSGVSYQVHKQVITAKDTSPSGGDDIHIVNEPTTPYQKIIALNSITQDANGDTIANNQFFNVMLYTVVNKSDEYAPLLLNLPIGTYGIESDATADIDQTTVYSLPREFTKEAGVAQPIARITLKKVPGGMEYVASQDLRDSFNVFGGGIASPQDQSFPDSLFEITNAADPTKILKFSAALLTASATRTLSAQDKDYVIADHADVVALQNEFTEDINDVAYTDSQGTFNTPKTGVDISIVKENTVAPTNIEGLTLASISYQQDVVSLGTINFDSVLGQNYYDWCNGVIIAGTGGNIVVTNNTGDVSDMFIVPLANTNIESETADEIAKRVPVYFEGLQGITDLSINTVCKNKFDGIYESGSFSSGNPVANSNTIRSKNFISIIDKDYTQSTTLASTSVVIYAYDSEFNYLGANSPSGATEQTYNPVTLFPNAKYIKFVYTGFSNTDVTLPEGTIQIELGTSATDYEQHKSQDLDTTGTLHGLGGISDDELVQRIDKATGVAIGATINNTTIPTMSTTSVFMAIDEVNGDYQTGNYGDVLTLTNTATVRFILADPLTRDDTNPYLINNTLLIGDTYTYSQSSTSGIINQFNAKSSKNLSSQVKLNQDTDVQQAKQLKDHENRIIKNETDIAQAQVDISNNENDIIDLQGKVRVLITSGASSTRPISTSTTKPANNVTVDQAITNFDELEIWVVDENFGDDKEYKVFWPVGTTALKPYAEPVQNDSGKINFHGFILDNDTTTAFSAYMSRNYFTDGTAASSRANMYISRIYGIKY